MGVFDDVALEWGGKAYCVPAKRMMRAIAAVESEITLGELWEGQRSGKMRVSQLAFAYGKLLRFAGVPVTDEQVYEGLFGGDETKSAVIEALNTLLSLVIPPSALKQLADGAHTDEELPPGNSPASGTPS